MRNRSVRWMDAGGLILLGIGLCAAINGCESAGRNDGAQPAVPASTPSKPQSSPMPQPMSSAPPSTLVSPPPAAPQAEPAQLDGRVRVPDAPSAVAPPPSAEPLRARPDDPPSAPQPPIEPSAPDYVAILDTIEPGKPARIVVEQESDRRLSLSTRNVRRIRIDRIAAQLASNRSVSLQLDGQGIEWAARSVTREFERTRTGLWQPVDPSAPR